MGQNVVFKVILDLEQLAAFPILAFVNCLSLGRLLVEDLVNQVQVPGQAAEGLLGFAGHFRHKQTQLVADHGPKKLLSMQYLSLPNFL